MATEHKRRRGRSLIKPGAVAGAMLSFAPACGSVAPHIYVIDCEQPVNGVCTCGGYHLDAQGECVLSSSTGNGDGGGDAG